MKNCPYCAEEIQDEALKCKHCGEFIDGRPRESASPQAREDDVLGNGWLVLIWGSLLIPCFGPWIVIFVSSIMYYKWRAQFPNKAKKINLHGWLAFIVGNMIAFGLYYMSTLPM